MFFPGDEANSYYIMADWQVVKITPQRQRNVVGRVTQSPNPDLSMIITWGNGSVWGVDHNWTIWSWDASGVASAVGEANPL